MGESHATTGGVASAADPRPAAMLMYATYASGSVGIFLAFLGLSASPPTLRWGSLVGVGLAGGLSFLRHAVYHRSDAARLGWDLGRRDTFQIEVGIANLAWALLAVLAVVLDWGIRVEAAAFLTFGLYLTMVAVLLGTSRHEDGTSRPWGNVAAMAAFGGMLVVVGVLGMRAV